MLDLLTLEERIELIVELIEKYILKHRFMLTWEVNIHHSYTIDHELPLEPEVQQLLDLLIYNNIK